MEFVFGISSERPRRNGIEPRWEDEKITAFSSHTYYQLMEKLCDTAIQKRREYADDSGINSHLWNLKIVSYENFISHDDPHNKIKLFRKKAKAERRELRRRARLDEEYSSEDDSSSDSSSDDSNDGNENMYRPSIVIHGPSEESAREYNFDDDELFSSTQNLSEIYLPVGTMIVVTYDYGSTTTLYLKVLRCQSSVVQSLLSYFTSEASEEDMKKWLDAVPAYKLHRNEQFDAFYPNLSKIFMGKYVPLVTSTQPEEDLMQINVNSGVTSSVILGKSACIYNDKDIQFCAIESRNGGDMMHSTAMENLDEFLATAEKAWTPREGVQNAENMNTENDDDLSKYRYDYIMRHLVAANDDELYASLQSLTKASAFGAKHIVIRGNNDRKPSGFDFEGVFPLTYKMITGDYFRWFHLKRDVLNVIVGRGIGPFHRDYHGHQILKSWKYSFESFHEVLCAVEASWVWKGKTMIPNQYLEEYDEFLGPSNPCKDPPVLVNEDKCEIITKNNDLKKLVTALAITEECGEQILYSGHDDGMLSKWNLDEHKLVWSKLIYKQDEDEDEGIEKSDYLEFRYTFGVAGIAIRPKAIKNDDHVIWTWTHAPGGYPKRNFENRTASKLLCWNSDGGLVKRLTCDVGDDDDGNNAHPTIGPVVFCDLNYECNDSSYAWFPCIVVGLHCLTQAPNWKGDYSDFSLLDQNFSSSEGNIRIFNEETGEEYDAWVERLSMIKSLAVVPRKYVISLSFIDGCGWPEAIILWDAYNPGYPLSRLDICSEKYMAYPNERLDGVCGMNVHGNHITFSEVYGTRIAGATIYKDEDGEPFIKLNGYGEVQEKYFCEAGGYSFLGKAASCGQYAAMANSSDRTVWIYDTTACADHEDLDRRKISEKEARMYIEEDDDENSPYYHAGRKMCKGMIKFPIFGGNKPNRKKKEKNEWWAFLDCDDKSDGLGDGGPVALAMRGRLLVAGFSNGTVTTATLPPEFELIDDDISANHLSSTSDIPSDEWCNPVLALP